MPDKNRKLIQEFKALGVPAASPQPRATKVSQFEKDFRDYLAAQQEARQQLTSDLVSPSRVANAAVPGAVGALTGYGSQILGAPGDIVGLYEEFKPESFRSAPASLQALPSTEQVQQLFAPKADSFIGRRMPEYEAGITGGNLYALGEGVAALPSLARGVGRGAKALGKEAGRRIDEAMLTGEGMLGSALAPARPNFIKETGGKGRYETKQEGPFYRVTQRKTEEGGSGNREVSGQVRSPDIAGRSGRGDVPQPISDEAIGLLIKDPSNFVSRAANAYTQGVAGRGYGLPEMPESSLAKQSAIGRVFQLAASGDNAYKQAVFEAYGRRYPKLVESTGAQNYDQLMEAAYRQLAKETADQFHTLPISMSYHRRGEGNYQNSGELLRDIYGNRHMYVYQGGDPHDFLNAVDPETGLNTNEMFRAVHDFYGHATHGNAFGPKGEEIAYGAHSQMYSPLARMAMAGETRGQNSFVNYTPINAELKQRINLLNEAKYEASRRGDLADVAEADDMLKRMWQDFQFAPQKSVLLPPEFLETSYTGGMPSWVSPLIVPDPGTTTSQFLTHYSHSPDLTFLDPKRYGTGIKGAEASRLRSAENPVMERSYFYTGDPALVRPEKGLGSHRYGAMGEGLYDLMADPLLFRPLAVEANRVPWTSQVNRGVVRAPQAEADVERLIKEYGYSGMANPDLGMAIMYDKTPVSPFAQGGAVSQDAMRMKAWDKQVQGKAAGGVTKVGKGIGKAIDVVTELKEAPKAGVFKPKRVQTVSEPQRMAFPGIYQRPDVIASEAASRVAPEDPALKQIFGVTREDLYQLGKSRQGNLPGELPGQSANPRGSAAAEAVMTRRNRQRILDVNAEAEKHPLLVQGMDPWYVMDPLYKRMVQLLGPEQANIEYRKMNTLMGMASPGSEVLDEIPRGTAAYFLQKQGRFPEFIEHLGKKQNERGDVPLDIINVPGHIYHQTAQAIPMGRYLETGELQMKSPKVPMYIEASQVPEIGLQTRTPVGDAHWSRAVGLADTRGARTIKGKEVVPGASVSNAEMAQLAPWWREQIAKELGIESVPAQARTWGVFSGQTGVTTPIGAPKLELLAQKIMETAERLGVSPETARDMVITGQTYAGKKDGGAVNMAEGGVTSDDLIVEERPL